MAHEMILGTDMFAIQPAGHYGANELSKLTSVPTGPRAERESIQIESLPKCGSVLRSKRDDQLMDTISVLPCICHRKGARSSVLKFASQEINDQS
jgi:hypothetical protein